MNVHELLFKPLTDAEKLQALIDLNAGQTVDAVAGLTLFIIYVVLLIVSVALAILLAPGPPDPTPPAALEDFTVPTASQSRPCPVLFGKRTITGPNVVWYGDLESVPIPAPDSGKK